MIELDDIVEIRRRDKSLTRGRVLLIYEGYALVAIPRGISHVPLSKLVKVENVR